MLGLTDPETVWASKGTADRRKGKMRKQGVNPNNNICERHAFRPQA